MVNYPKKLFARIDLAKAYQRIGERFLRRYEEFARKRLRQPWYRLHREAITLSLLGAGKFFFRLGIILFKSAGESYLILPEEELRRMAGGSLEEFARYQKRLRLSSSVMVVLLSVVLGSTLHLILPSWLTSKAATNWYVRKTGNDSNNCTSAASACLTIQGAENKADDDGSGSDDIIYVGAGTYEETITVSVSGASGTPMKFIADTAGTFTGDAGNVIVDGATAGFNSDVDRNYISIEGFHITGSTNGISTGTSGFSESTNWTITNNRIYNNTSNGIASTDGDNMTITNNVIYGNATDGIVLSCNGSQTALDNTVTGNTIFGNGGEGIQICGGGETAGQTISNNTVYGNTSHGIYLLGSSGDGTDNSTVSHNSSFGNGGSGILFSGTATNNTIFNNLVYENLSDGFNANYGGSGEKELNGSTIANNTFANNGGDGIELIRTPATANTVKDNIITNNGALGINSTAAAISNSYNDVWNNTSGNFGGGASAGTGDITTPPSFTGSLTDGSGTWSLEFDNSNDIITISDNNAFDLTNMTVEAWINSDGLANVDGVVTRLATAGQRVFALHANSSKGMEARIYADGSNIACSVNSAIATRDNAWNHVALIMDDTNDKLYVAVNGVVASTSCTSSMKNNSTDDILIGTSSGGSFFDGHIDEVRISDSARYTSTFTPSRSLSVDANTVTLYHFDDSSGQTVTDSSGNALHGTLGASSSSASDDPAWSNADPEFVVYLQDTATSHATTSAAINAGSQTASAASLDTKTTRTDNITDSGTVDMGYHYTPPPPVFTQSAYRFYSNANSTDVGSALGDLNSEISRVGNGSSFRLRMLIDIATGPLSSSGQNFKLQFAEQSGSCDTSFSGETYQDVGAPGSATAIRYYNNSSPADGVALTTNANDPTHSGHTVVAQTYEEQNDFTNSQGAIIAGRDGLWDFVLEDNAGATVAAPYCFRIVKSDGSALDTYSVIPAYAVNAAPVVSNVSASQGSSGTVTIGYDVSDAEQTSMRIAFGIDFGITLSDNPLAASSTSLTVSSATALPSTGTIIIEKEEISYTGKSSNTLTGLTRGANSTVGASHTQGNAVYLKASTVSGHAGSGVTVGTGKSATWTIASDLDGVYTASAILRVLAHDGQTINPVGVANSSSFTLDVKDPTLGSPAIRVDASQSPARVTLAATDDTALEQKLGLQSDLSGSSFVTYNASSTISLSSSDSVIYVQFRDAKGNTTTIQSATLPATPTQVITQDISNVNFSPAEYRIFVNWKVIAIPTHGFAKYNVFRSTDNSSFTQIATSTDRLVNYAIDSTVSADTVYYYRVTSQDSNGNISFNSSSVTAKPNGAQDQGEGGGGTESAPTISNVASGSITAQTATITWTTDTLSNSTVEYSTTAGSYTSSESVASFVTSHSVILSGLTPNTTYYFRVKSTDAFSQTTTNDNSGSGFSFTTSQGATISEVSVTKVTNTSATIQWETDTSSDSFVIYSANADLSSSQTAGTSNLVSSGPPYIHVVNVTGLSAGTKYYFYVQSTDAQANTVQDKNVVDGTIEYFTFTTISDATGPTISSVQAILVTDSSAVITWSTNEPSTSQVEYGTTSGNFNNTSSLKSDLDNSHSVVLTGLSHSTTYYYRVKSKDEANNLSTSGEFSFATIEAQVPASRSGSGGGGGGGGGSGTDRVPPVVSNVAIASDSAGLVNVTWTTSEDATAFVFYGTSAGSYTELVSIPQAITKLAKSHKISVKGLDPNRLYYFKVASQDGSGNLALSAEFMFTPKEGIITPEEPQETPEETTQDIAITEQQLEKAKEALQELVNNNTGPLVDFIKDVSQTVSGPRIIGEQPEVIVRPSEVIISWKTDQPSTSLVALAPEQFYNPRSQRPYLNEIGSTSAYVTDHQVTLTNLLPGTLYHYQLRSQSSFGRRAQSKDFTFTTLSDGPTITSPRVETLSTSSAKVTWTTNVLADSLVVVTPLKAGRPDTTGQQVQGSKAFVTRHDITVRNMKSGTSYTIEIQSKDQFGNVATHTFPPFATGQDINPPLISSVRSNAAVVPGKRLLVQTIISWTTDEPSTSQVFWLEGVGTLRDLSKAQSTAIDNNLTTNHIAVVTSLKPGSVYRFVVKSVDERSNQAISREFSILTPQQGETVIDLIVKNFQEIFGFLSR